MREMVMERQPVYQFGSFQLDPSQKILLHGGVRVPLNPKTFLLLLALIEAEGQVRSKDELLMRVWPDVVVEENNLTKNISVLRKALSNGAESAEFIENIPKVGYRFRAEIRQAQMPIMFANDTTAAGDGVTSKAEETGPPNDSFHRSIKKPVRLRWLWAGLAVALVIGVMLAWAKWPRTQPSAKPIMPAASVAVLPFKNLTGDVSQDYFTDGFAEGLADDLSRIKDLKVISRNSVFTFKGQGVDVREAGRKLNVAAILEGTVQREGDQWRITATLRETANGREMWRSEHHYQPLEDIFVIQHEIRCNVAANLQVILCNDGSDREHTKNLEAYLAYLKGLSHFNLRTSESLKQAIKYFEQAVALDPNYAEAWASIADAYYLSKWYGSLPPETVARRGGAAAKKALTLDGSSALALLMACIYLNDEGHTAESAELSNRIPLANPNFARFYHSAALYKSLLGHYDEGIKMMRRAQELDPLSLVVNTDTGYAYYIARRYDEAIAIYQSTLTMDSKFSLAHLLLGLALSQQGKHAEAINEVQQASERGSEYLAALGNVYARARRRQEAMETLENLRRLAQHQFVPPYQFAWIYCGLGDLEHAVDSLQKSARQKAGVIDFKHHPVYEPLRDDARYQQLLSQAAYPW
ncbi:MAG: winged helix-turn-helix domain-containing protein [Acidobacteriota bacterium]